MHKKHVSNLQECRTKKEIQFETNEKSKTYVVDEKGKRINEECRYKKIQTDEFRLRG